MECCFDKPAGKKLPKLQEVRLVVIRSKKVALFESVVCLIKVLQNCRSYERQMEWNYFAECPKLFLFLNFWENTSSSERVSGHGQRKSIKPAKKSFERLEIFPIEGQNYQTQKHSFGKVPFAINSLNKWNNFLLTVPEVILRNTKSFSIKIWKWTLNFYFVYTLSFSSHNVSRCVERNPDNEFGLFLDLCRKLFA